MGLDISTVGFETEPVSFTYDWKMAALYALAVGATPEELDYVYEGRGPRVLPTFAVIPSYGPVSQLFVKTSCDMTRLVHGGQTLRLHRPLPPEGTLLTTGRIEGIYDMKILAKVVLSTRTTLNGEPCFDTEWELLVRDAGGFGGARPPKAEVPKLPKDQLDSPTFAVEQATRPEQALLYRLTGDLNPLHADPAFARAAGFDQGPILHGLCTYGFVGRALLKHACGGDPARLKAFSVQFRKPVWPGDVLSTKGYDVGNGRYALDTTVVGRPDAVLTSAWAEVA
ncbi:MAG: MaoC family protein [Myxococcales bacterium]|nr:MAG: MaoC family protein [Myxococcales bacterium]